MLPWNISGWKTVLVFEGRQAKNFIKQFLKFGRHMDQAGRKLDKKGRFKDLTKNLTSALGEILFNVSSPCFKNFDTVVISVIFSSEPIFFKLFLWRSKNFQHSWKAAIALLEHRQNKTLSHHYKHYVNFSGFSWQLHGCSVDKPWLLPGYFIAAMWQVILILSLETPTKHLTTPQNKKLKTEIWFIRNAYFDAPGNRKWVKSNRRKKRKKKAKVGNNNITMASYALQTPPQVAHASCLGPTGLLPNGAYTHPNQKGGESIKM